MSTTSFAIIISSIICLPGTNALWHGEINPFETFFNLAVTSSFETALYKQPTRQIGLKSSSPKGFNDFGIKVRKEYVIAFDRTVVLWKSMNSLMKSSLRKCQHLRMKKKLHPFGPGLLDPSQSHTASFTSSSINDASRKPLSSIDNELK